MRSSTPDDSQNRRILERVTTAYNVATVVGRGRTRHLEVDGATYATFHPVRRFFGYAWDALAAVALHHPNAADGGRGLRILLIGLGGGTSLHSLRVVVPRAKLVTAEIDPILVEISRRHFALGDTGARVVVGDGYAHVDQHPGAYDIILDDAFLSHGEAARTEEVSHQLIKRLAAGLSPGGLLASNVFTDVANRPSRDRARRLFRDHFSHSFELVPPKGANAILCGTHAPRPAAEVAAQIQALPQAARRALTRIRGPGMAP